MDKNDVVDVRLLNLLEYIQITNPSMTLDKLTNELAKSDYSCLALYNTMEQVKRKDYV